MRETRHGSGQGHFAIGLDEGRRTAERDRDKEIKVKAFHVQNGATRPPHVCIGWASGPFVSTRRRRVAHVY